MKRLAVIPVAALALAAPLQSAARTGKTDVRRAPVAADMPNASINPGAVDPHVTQADIHRTICVHGYTRTVRPPESYTNRVKRQQITAYHYADRKMHDYELDHLISLELGGAPSDPRNLWPEPYHVVGGWNAHAKDRLENRLHRLVCSGKLSLAAAQGLIAHHWIEAYRKYVGLSPARSRRD